MKSKIVELEVGAIVVTAGSNPREKFDNQRLLALGESLEHETQLSPVIVNRIDGKNILIAGERRLRAAQLAKQPFIEARVFEDLDALTAVRMQMAENLQRVELDPVEEANAYNKLAELGMATSDIASEIGISEETVKRRLALLELSSEVQRLISREVHPLPIHQALLLKGLSESEQIQTARRAAPVVGPVAGEAEVRGWVAEIKKGPELKMQTEPKQRTQPANSPPVIKPDPDKPQTDTPEKTQTASSLKPVEALCSVKGKLVIVDGVAYFKNATVTVKCGDSVEIMHQDSLELPIDDLAKIAAMAEAGQPKKKAKKKKKD